MESWVKDYCNEVIPLPPLTIQHQIASTLDKAAELVALRKQQLEELDALAQSVFYNLFGDPVKNEKGWEKKTIGNLINSIESGCSVNGMQRKLLNSEIGVLKVSAVTSGYFKEDEYKVVDDISSLKKHIIPQKGDLLFSRANTREKVGATCIVWKCFPSLRLPDKLWRINLNKKANNIFIKFILTDNGIREALSKEATGTSGSMYNISMAKLKSIAIPLPPISLQNRFAAIIEKIEAQKEDVRKALQESDDLFQRLMQESFNPQ